MAEYNESQINSNETERISAEQQRINNEAQRQTKETEREAREATRQSNESTRISKEAERLAEEVNRVEAEASRVTAEQGRVEAENIRAEFYDGFTERLNQVDSQLVHNTINSNYLGLNPSTFGVIGDGVIDDTENLQSFIDYCNSNNVVMLLNGTYLTKGVTFGEGSKVIGNATFCATSLNQPYVVQITGRIEWQGQLKVDGMNKAKYGVIANSFIHSHFNDVIVSKCKVWGFVFEKKGNNAMVQVDKFQGTYNGMKHTTGFTVSASQTSGAHVIYTITLDTYIGSEDYYSNEYDVIYAIYNGRPYRATVLGVNSVNIYNLPLSVGETGNIDIIIGGALNIPSYGDNGVGNWGVLDIFGNQGVGINMSALYGHNFNRPVMQGNSIGIACQDISLGVTLNSPYFEQNTVDFVVWNYMHATMTDAIISYDKMFSLVNHRIYGKDYNKHLTIIGQNIGYNKSNELSASNPPDKTIYPSMNYSFWYNENQTSKTFTIKNDLIYTNTYSNYIYMTLQFVAGATLTFKLANEGDTIQGGTTYSVNVSGSVFISITKIGSDWKVVVLQKEIERTSMPTGGTYKIGDYVKNTSLVEKGESGSKYIVMGWIRITDGNTNKLNTDWVEDRRITGN